jgi:hypothetical protein
MQNGNWHETLTCVRGYPGHLFMCPGNIGSGDISVNIGNCFFSTNGGLTWSRLGVETLGGAANNEIDGVQYISIGAVKPGKTYPTIWMEGKINGVFGRYYCVDADPTTTGKWPWYSVEAFPLGWMDFTSCLSADPDKWHTCYSAAGGSGYHYTTQDDLTVRTFEITT